MYVINKKTKKIHLASCRFAVSTNNNNRHEFSTDEFNTLEKALKNYKRVIPCDVCLKAEDDTRNTILNSNIHTKW